MKFPRPPNRAIWWLAFAVTSLPVPLLIVVAGLLISASISQYLFPVALLGAPLGGCYLLGITRLPLLAKIGLITTFYILVVFAFLPRPMCGEEDSSATTVSVAKNSGQESHGCS